MMAGRRHVAAEGDDPALATELARLESLDLDALRARWLKVTGKPAPRAFRRKLLVSALAYEIQVATYGGLPAALKRRLRELAVAARDRRFDEALGTPSIKPGTLLIRVWQGTTHRVMVTSDGFAWDGRTYRSLSSIAKAITGTQWNGWVFFGLKRSDGRNKNAAKARPEAGADAHA
jgi:hypothetical protein